MQKRFCAVVWGVGCLLMLNLSVLPWAAEAADAFGGIQWGDRACAGSISDSKKRMQICLWVTLAG